MVAGVSVLQRHARVRAAHTHAIAALNKFHIGLRTRHRNLKQTISEEDEEEAEEIMVLGGTSTSCVCFWKQSCSFRTSRRYCPGAKPLNENSPLLSCGVATCLAMRLELSESALTITSPALGVFGRSTTRPRAVNRADANYHIISTHRKGRGVRCSYVEMELRSVFHCGGELCR